MDLAAPEGFCSGLSTAVETGAKYKWACILRPWNLWWQQGSFGWVSVTCNTYQSPVFQSSAGVLPPTITQIVTLVGFSFFNMMPPTLSWTESSRTGKGERSELLPSVCHLYHTPMRLNIGRAFLGSFQLNQRWQTLFYWTEHLLELVSFQI